jgi:Protein of unknown function (DUF4238)
MDRPIRLAKSELAVGGGRRSRAGRGEQRVVASVWGVGKIKNSISGACNQPNRVYFFQMSTPKKHHYLPEFYLKRWAVDGKLFRYERPRGANGELHCSHKSPAAVGYIPNLYQIPDQEDPKESQSLELNLFQKIDDRAAAAFQKFDRFDGQIEPTESDHLALCQFTISLLHRTPKRLDALKIQLSNEQIGAPFAGMMGEEYDVKLKSTTNRLLELLVLSDDYLPIFSRFKAGRIISRGTSKTFLTSDRPMTASSPMLGPDSFMILPYAPDRILLFANKKSIIDSFSAQKSDILVKGINEAIVEQSENLIISSNKDATKMIDRLFLQSKNPQNGDPTGLIRRRAPMVNFRPNNRNFSRHDKSTMKYLGR